MPIDLKLLGQTSTAAEVIALLRTIGAKPPKLRRGEAKAYVLVQASGLQLIFTDEAEHTGDPLLAPGEGALILTNITFHTTASKGFKSYADHLPFGARFEMSRAALRAHLGQPEESDDDLCLDRWTIQGLWFFARYVKDLSCLLLCGVQIPAQEE